MSNWQVRGLIIAGIVTIWAIILAVAAGCEQKPQPTGESTAAGEAARKTEAPQATAKRGDSEKARNKRPVPEQGKGVPPTTPPTARKPLQRPLGSPTGTFIDREHPDDLRLVSYNILWNNIFVEESAQNANRFVRVVRALDPDILALQEVGLPGWMRERNPDARDWNEQDVVHLMNAIAPLPEDGTWYGHMGSDNVIVSKFPLKMEATQTTPRGDRPQAMALVDLPDDDFTFDFYIMNNHYKCCSDKPENELRRQKQSDAIVAWLRDARTPGGEIDLAAGTALAVVGDLNIVQGYEPVATLVTGDIVDEATYGEDFAPDWDDSDLLDTHPLHNAVGPDDYTWRDDTDQWDPGRLDYIIVSDSMLEIANKFVLNTTTMSPQDLERTGLQVLDVCVDDAGERFDHLPLVVDLRPRVPEAVE